MSGIRIFTALIALGVTANVAVAQDPAECQQPSAAVVAIDALQQLQNELNTTDDILITEHRRGYCTMCQGSEQECRISYSPSPDSLAADPNLGAAVLSGDQLSQLGSWVLRRYEDYERYAQQNQGLDCGRGVCCDVAYTVTREHGKPQALGEVSLEVIEISWDAPRFLNSPLRTSGVRIVLENCGSLTQNSTRTVTVSERRVDTVSFASTVSRTRQLSTTLSTQLTIPIGGPEGPSLNLGGSAARSFSRQVSLTSGESCAFESAITQSASVNLNVAPNTIGIAEAVSSVWEGSVDFTARVVADSPLASNLAGLRLASDVLDETARTFVISGTLSLEALTELSVSYRELPVSSDCTGVQTVDEPFGSGRVSE